MDEIALLKLYLNPTLIDDIQSAKSNSVAIFEQFNVDQVALVSMNDVLKLEMNLSDVPKGIPQYLDRLEAKQIDLETRFRFFLKVIFYRRKAIAENDENIDLLGLSSMMAESEALIHVGEYKMIGLIKTFMGDKSFLLDRFLSINKIIIDILILRLNKHAIENGILKAETRIKRIYVLLRYYERDLSSGISDLARDYFYLSRNRRTRLSEIERSLQTYHKAIEDAPSEVLTKAMNDIVCVFHQIIKKWLSGTSRDTVFIEKNLDASTFEDIQKAKLKSYKKIARPRPQDFEDLNPDGMLRYECQLLSGFFFFS